MSRVIGMQVSGVDLVFDSEVCMGAALKLGNGSELLILNCGDELAVVLDGDHGLLREPNVIRRTFA